MRHTSLSPTERSAPATKTACRRRSDAVRTTSWQPGLVLERPAGRLGPLLLQARKWSQPPPLSSAVRKLCGRGVTLVHGGSTANRCRPLAYNPCACGQPLAMRATRVRSALCKPPSLPPSVHPSPAPPSPGTTPSSRPGRCRHPSRATRGPLFFFLAFAASPPSHLGVSACSPPPRPPPPLPTSYFGDGLNVIFHKLLASCPSLPTPFLLLSSSMKEHSLSDGHPSIR